MSDAEGRPYISPSLTTSSHGTTPARDSLFQFLNHSQLNAEIGQILQEELGCICALEMNKSFLEVAENKILNSIQIGFEYRNDRLNNASFHCVEIVLSDFALKGALIDLLNQNIKKWT